MTFRGDLAAVRLPGNLPHIMIVCDRSAPVSARPLALRNIGAGAREEDAPYLYPGLAHFRITPEAAARLRAPDRP